MPDLLVLLRSYPYGIINAAEAIRHAGGAGGAGYSATLYLIDGGVLVAKKGQDAGETGFSNLGESLELLSDEMEIYAHKESLDKMRLGEDDLIEGIKLDDGSALKEKIKNAQSVMIF